MNKTMSPLPTIEPATLGGVSSGLQGEITGAYTSNPLHMQVMESPSLLTMHHHHHNAPAYANELSSEEKRKQAPVSSDDKEEEGPTKKRRTSSVSDDSVLPASTEAIETYEDQDVLSGRGGGTNAHPGNRRFRDLIHMHRRTYLKARKNDKPAISRAIVKAIRDGGGRFLKKEKGHWVEIGDVAAREKTSQALRQRAPEMRQLLFESDNASNAAATGGAHHPITAAPVALPHEAPGPGAVVVVGGHQDGSYASSHHHHPHQGMYVTNHMVHHPNITGANPAVVHHMGQVYAVAPPPSTSTVNGVQVVHHHHILPAPPATHQAPSHHAPITLRPSTAQHQQVGHQPVAYQI